MARAVSPNYLIYKGFKLLMRMILGKRDRSLGKQSLSYFSPTKAIRFPQPYLIKVPL
jgi:hypothetical protein